jgi:hypothetical protein
MTGSNHISSGMDYSYNIKLKSRISSLLTAIVASNPDKNLMRITTCPFLK